MFFNFKCSNDVNVVRRIEESRPARDRTSLTVTSMMVVFATKYLRLHLQGKQQLMERYHEHLAKCTDTRIVISAPSRFGGHFHTTLDQQAKSL